MDTNQKVTYKSLLLDTMRDFIQFCEKYNLKYVGAYGTVLGAIRHQGLIPWDDDIDVFMLRSDYERFLKLKAELDHTSYEIIDKSNEGYYLSFAKFCNKNTSLWEFEEYPYVMGVFIDVFPLDEISSDNPDQIKLRNNFCSCWNNYSLSIIDYSFRQYCKSLITGKIRGIVLALRARLLRMYKKNTLFKELLDMENLIKIQKGKEYMYYLDDGEGHYLKKEWIEKTVDVDYEDLKIHIPEAYDEYLREQYGDYMQLPPVDKRQSGHSHYFMDLSKRLTIENIKELKCNARK